MIDANTLLRTIGTNIRQIRTEKKLSRLDLAGALHVSQSYIGKLEIGDTNPTALMLAKVADALDIQVARLFDPVKVEDERLPFEEVRIAEPTAVAKKPRYNKRPQHEIEPARTVTDHTSCDPNTPESLCEECRGDFEEARAGAL